jgi:hypothetical protein
MTYTNATSIPYQGSTLGHHVVLNYVDADGHHHTLQGGPENPFQHNMSKLMAFLQEEGLSDGVNNTDSPFGRLIAVEKDTDNSPNQPYTMIAEGDDLSPHWALMRDFADEVNSTGYEYRPMSQNSNSFAAGALQRGGFLGPGNRFPERFNRQTAFDPAIGQTSPRFVPGFEAPLANPINTEMPMPFPLDMSAPRPPNGATAPGRRSSFDGSPLNSDYAGAGGQRDAQWPTEPSNDDGPVTLNEAYLLYRKRLDSWQP